MIRKFTILILFLVFNFSITVILAKDYTKKQEGNKKNMEKFKDKVEDSNNPLIQIETSKGIITLELYIKIAPETVKNFLGLAQGSISYIHPKTQKKQTNKPYYDNVIFHRVIPKFMIQGGDILGTGTGGPGFTFEDEINADALGLDKITLEKNQQYTRDAQMYLFKKLNINSQEDLEKNKAKVDEEAKKVYAMSIKTILEKVGYKFNSTLKSVPVSKYTIAMANAGPNTNGSQFFINLVDNHFLNGKHTVFGKVIDGFSVVDAIGEVTTNPQTNKPEVDVVIKKITLFK